ncbi:MAG: hypothetical protein HF973_03355 [Chloroflexi bacterium]|nr:hypothetical protein [Chloroflexota bacterium]
MNFDLLLISILVGLGLIYAVLVKGKWRGWFLLVASVVAIYWLQTATAVRFGDYILQTVTVLLTALTWWVTRPSSHKEGKAVWPSLTREDWLTLAVVFGLVVAMAFNRFVAADYRLTPARPPSPLWVAGILLALGLVWAGLTRLLRRADQRKVLTAVILLIVLIFIILKAPPLTTAAAAYWRSLTGQQIALASPSDLVWLGFSYVAFRLISTLRDRQTGILPDLNLREYVTYVLFFPSYISGPIDRAERFVEDFRQLPQLKGLDANRWLYGGQRIFAGMLKKFVIADSLALGMSLTAENAAQTQSAGWLWVLLYGYALRLFFDFSGYTDIAIGLGVLFGIRLPENFIRPYLSTNITAFWQRWHITLSDWARFYVFSPLSRSLLRRKPRPSKTLIIFLSQMSTMLVIGLWHGITWNFIIWGAWHGIALFAHKQWSDKTRRWYNSLSNHPRQKRSWTAVTWFLTFNYVALGWVWFLMPTPQLALETFGKLFGLIG